MATSIAPVVEQNARAYRRTWRGSIIMSFISPLLYLGAIGMGLGSLVQRNSGNVAGVPYLDFLGPALLVASCMQTAIGESAYPVLGKITWERLYEAMLATPISPREIALGEVTWLGLRLSITATLFFAVLIIFGIARVWSSILALPVAIAVGLAFGAPMIAFAATRRDDRSFSTVFRFLIMPLFLLSGTFFPISQLPLFFQGVAWVFPLSHGVSIARDAVLNHLQFVDAFHAAVISLYIVLGTVAALLTLQRRLRV